MSEKYGLYKCNVCGNIVEVVNAGGGTLVCCGQPMELKVPKTQDAGLEKHVPVIEETGSGYKVKVGSVPHPMEQAHYIMFIELVADGALHRKELKPGEKPEAEFMIPKAKSVFALEYCNLHGLWRSV